MIIPRCSFCDKEDFTVVDVNTSEKIKRYTDSPYYNTFQSRTGNTFGNTLKGINLAKELMDFSSPALEEISQTPRENKSNFYESTENFHNPLTLSSDGFSNKNREEIKILTIDKKMILNELKSKGINDSPMNVTKRNQYTNLLILM